MRKSVLLFFISTVVVFGCKQQKSAVEEPDIASLRQEIKATQVLTAPAEYRAFEFRINSSGIIESKNELKITFQAGGYLEQLLIHNGQRVKKGQLLAQLENEKEKLNLQKAKLAIEKAQVAYESDSLSRSNNFSPRVKRTLELNSGLVTSKVSLQEAELNLANTKVVSPISGIISEVNEKQGNLVSGGATLALIYDPDKLVLEGKVLETDFRHLKTGLKADIYPLSFPEKAFEATLTEINPRVDENGMITLKLTLDETNGLLPGMSANAVIKVPQSENVIVPREALVMKSGRPVVFTLSNGLAKWNYVELGLDNGVDLEITKGVEAGSTVIISNNLQLAHDAKVAVQNSELRE